MQTSFREIVEPLTLKVRVLAREFTSPVTTGLHEQKGFLVGELGTVVKGAMTKLTSLLAGNPQWDRRTVEINLESEFHAALLALPENVEMDRNSVLAEGTITGKMLAILREVTTGRPLQDQDPTSPLARTSESLVPLSHRSRPAFHKQVYEMRARMSGCFSPHATDSSTYLRENGGINSSNGVL